MNLLTFGPAGRRLFGLYHPPSAQNITGQAVLMCLPFGHEAMRIHRFYRLMADRLARRGVAVLRFDYHGTGDSPGDDDDADLDGWASDVRQAHEELRRQSQATQITWFGARLGASAALLAAAHPDANAARLVLWDPVLDGPTYLETLRVAHVDELEAGHCIPDPAWRRSLADPNAFAGECLGFAIPARFRNQILALQPDNPMPLGGMPIELLSPEPDGATQRWCRAAVARQPAARVGHVPFTHPLIWTSNPHANNEMVPAEALQRMIAHAHGNH